MVTGKTTTGFEYSMNLKRLKDARLLREMAQVRKDGDGVGELLVIEKMLGPEQFEALCTHCEDEEGIADVEALKEEFIEIVKAVGESQEGKN